MIREKKEETQINNIRNRRSDVTTDSPDNQRIIKNIMSNFMPINLAA